MSSTGGSPTRDRSGATTTTTVAWVSIGIAVVAGMLELSNRTIAPRAGPVLAAINTSVEPGTLSRLDRSAGDIWTASSDESGDTRSMILLGNCAFARSDKRYIGIVIGTKPDGVVRGKDPTSTQRVVLVHLTASVRESAGTSTMAFAYPEAVDVSRCPGPPTRQPTFHEAFIEGERRHSSWESAKTEHPEPNRPKPHTGNRVYYEFEVQEEASPLPASGVPRYPVPLHASGVRGETHAQFIVGRDGRVEKPSIKILQSTNELFTASLLEALPAMRFSPALARGRKVRQLVQQKIVLTEHR